MLVSQLLRPNDLVRFDTPYYALAPIAGLQMDEQAVLVGDLMLIRCNRAEWETVEHGYVFKDWHARYYDANPVFLYKRFTEPIVAEQISVVLDELARDAARLVSAFRLYKTGHLLEPIYTARFLINSYSTYREVGPYRIEYLAMPVDGLTWPLDANEVQDVGLVYANLKIMEQTVGTEPLRAAIDQFNLSHTPLVPSYFSVHLLLTVIEMLFDGISKQIDVKTTRYERALQSLRWAEGAELDPAFNDFYLNRIHDLRNAIHHHALRNSNADMDDAKYRLQKAIALGIRLLMRLHRFEVVTVLTKLQRDRGWQSPGPKDVLNGCLDLYVRGDPAPFEELMTPLG